MTRSGELGEMKMVQLVHSPFAHDYMQVSMKDCAIALDVRLVVTYIDVYYIRPTPQAPGVRGLRRKSSEISRSQVVGTGKSWHL